MKRQALGLAGAVLATITVTAGCGQAGSSSGTVQSIPSNAQVVHVVSQDYSWTLDKTTFSDKQPIAFELSCLSGEHGFQVVGTNISVPIASGQNKTVLWTPTKAGTYTIRCDIVCGPGHDDMHTTFTVS